MSCPRDADGYMIPHDCGDEDRLDMPPDPFDDEVGPALPV